MKEFFKAHFETPSRGPRSLPMEGMRGGAALLVFLVHFNTLFHPYFATGSRQLFLLDVAGNFGHVGVDLFFVISGFLIYGILMEKEPKYLTFIGRRARRLYPVFLVVLFLYLVLSFLFPAESRLPKSVIDAVLYITANVAMLPGMTRIPAIITVSWSLSYEWFFYLGIPVVISILGLRRWNSNRRVLLFLSCSALQLVLAAAGVLGHVRLVMFGCGIILWELGVLQGLSSHLKPWGEYASIAAFLLGLAVIGFSGARHGHAPLTLGTVPIFYSSILFVTVFFFCSYALCYQGILSSVFSWDYLRWIGNISYS